MAIGEDAGGNATLDTNDPQFKVCTEMMQVKAEKLKKTVLEKRRNFSKEEVVWSPRSKRAAEGARDSLCRYVAPPLAVAPPLPLAATEAEGGGAAVELSDAARALGLHAHGHAALGEASSCQSSYPHPRFLCSPEKDSSPAIHAAEHRHIYWLAFDDLVQEINRCLSSDARSAYNIGVLDIFGFENFNENLFSQLCINLTNESLHNLFIEHVFKDEQQVYMANDIQWNFVEYQDNSHTIDLIYKCHPKNLFT